MIYNIYITSLFRYQHLVHPYIQSILSNRYITRVKDVTDIDPITHIVNTIHTVFLSTTRGSIHMNIIYTRKPVNTDNNDIYIHVSPIDTLSMGISIVEDRPNTLYMYLSETSNQINHGRLHIDSTSHTDTGTRMLRSISRMILRDETLELKEHKEEPDKIVALSDIITKILSSRYL